jgi:hypothetical protein
MSVLETGFLTFKNMQIDRWSELWWRLLIVVKITKQLKHQAALFSYLVPCYLTVLMECSNTNADGALFFCQVVVQLLDKIESMLNGNQEEPEICSKALDTTEVLAQVWILQNKVTVFCSVLVFMAAQCSPIIFLDTVFSPLMLLFSRYCKW